MTEAASPCSFAPDSMRMPSKKEMPPCSAVRSTFFQCLKASANLSRSSSTHFPLRATKPPDDSRMARNSFSSSGCPSNVTATEKSSNASALILVLLPTVTLTTGRGGREAFHQSGTRTISPLSSSVGISFKSL